MVLLFFLSAFISEVAGTIAGFGSSTLFLPLALLFTEYKTALVLVTFVHLFGNIGRIDFFRHALHKKYLFTFAKDSYKIKLTFLNAFIGGAASGFMAGLIGTGGSFRGAFLTGFGLSKGKYIATAAAIVLSVDMARILVYFVQDFLEGVR